MAPPQKPGNSEQDVQTPPEFLRAVKGLLNAKDFTIDLAASHDNAVTHDYYSLTNNSLDPLNPWFRAWPGWAWCNPPFAKIEPWVKKAYMERHMANVAMLLPAGVGSNWFRDWVHRKASVLLLNGRLTFVGHDQPYPKDCILVLTGPRARTISDDYDVWEWGA